MDNDFKLSIGNSYRKFRYSFVREALSDKTEKIMSYSQWNNKGGYQKRRNLS